MDIYDRLDQHFKELDAILGGAKVTLAHGLDQLGEEAKSKVELDIASVKNKLHKMLLYIEKKGSEA
jgi:hypothetical protein